MKIIRETVPTATLEQFANQHGLTLRVTERRLDDRQRANGLKRFVASFDCVEIKDGGMLVSASGTGDTEDAAIRAYAVTLSCKRIAVNAMSRERQDIDVPRLVVENASPAPEQP